MKILIIGLGSIAKKHIDAIYQLDNTVQIYALRSSNSNHGNEITRVINIYDLNDINMSEIDFVVISNPTGLHFTTIKQLSIFKTPLFIEKPLFSDINKEGEELVNEIEKNNITTYVACNLRFLASIKELKNLLKDLNINEVNVYCGSYLPDWRPDVDFRTIYSANKDMGGGVHIDLIHELDYVYWLFGMPLKTNSFFSSNSSLAISSYDYANYLWKYQGFSASIILNYYRKDSKRAIEVVTDKGTYFVDLLKNTIDFNNKCIFASQKRISDTYYDQMDFFIHNILDKNEKFNTIAEAYNILKLCMKG